MEYTSISHILRKAPAQYMRAYLHTETDKNDTTYFLLHQLQTVRQAIAALHEYVARKAREQKETERLLAAFADLARAFQPPPDRAAEPRPAQCGRGVSGGCPSAFARRGATRRRGGICWNWKNRVCWKGQSKATRMSFMLPPICVSD
jgi:hypothetical protein